MITRTSRVKYNARPHTSRSYLAVQGLLIGQLILQLVIEVMDGRGLALRSQVALLECCDSLLHVFLLGQSLGQERRAREGKASASLCPHPACTSSPTPDYLYPPHASLLVSDLDPALLLRLRTVDPTQCSLLNSPAPAWPPSTPRAF